MKKLGFGCMRLPMSGGEVDVQETTRMVDAFMENGFNYFDTAHGYIDGKSETAIRDCLAARYDREDFVLANKLSYWCFEKEEDIPVIELPVRTEHSSMEQILTSFIEAISYYFAWLTNRLDDGFEPAKIGVFPRI